MSFEIEKYELSPDEVAWLAERESVRRTIAEETGIGSVNSFVASVEHLDAWIGRIDSDWLEEARGKVWGSSGLLGTGFKSGILPVLIACLDWQIALNKEASKRAGEIVRVELSKLARTEPF